jgi:glycosyltransferase involved in cell wall biosynthesis
VKLIVQIPCLNEEATLPATIAAIPRHIEGIDQVEVLVIDDGSTDRTSQLARQSGADHLIRFPRNRGLGQAFKTGFDTCQGADIIVNTDADNQYHAGDICKLVEPILAGRAELVVGDRGVGELPEHFSAIKRRLQRLGSGQRRLAVVNVPIRTNPKARESRLFSHIGAFALKSGLISLRSYTRYRSLKVFALCGAITFIGGFLLGLRFLCFFLFTDQGHTHVQSLILASILLLAGFHMWLTGIVADLIATNRSLLEEALSRIRKIELAQRAEQAKEPLPSSPPTAHPASADTERTSS